MPRVEDYPTDPLDQMAEFLKLREFVQLMKQGGSLLMWENDGLHLKWIMLDDSCNYLCWTKPRQDAPPEDSHSLSLDKIQDVVHGSDVNRGVLFDGRSVPDETSELSIMLVLKQGGHIDVVAPSVMSLYVWLYGLRFILGLDSSIPKEFEELLAPGGEGIEGDDTSVHESESESDDYTDTEDAEALDSEGYEMVEEYPPRYVSDLSANPGQGDAGGDRQRPKTAPAGGRVGVSAAAAVASDPSAKNRADGEGYHEADTNAEVESLRAHVGEQRQIILNLLQENRVLAEVRAQKDKTISTLMNQLRLADLDKTQKSTTSQEDGALRGRIHDLEKKVRSASRQLDQMTKLIEVKDETIRELSRLLRQAGGLPATR